MVPSASGLDSSSLLGCLGLEQGLAVPVGRSWRRIRLLGSVLRQVVERLVPSGGGVVVPSGSSEPHLGGDARRRSLHRVCSGASVDELAGSLSPTSPAVQSHDRRPKCGPLRTVSLVGQGTIHDTPVNSATDDVCSAIRCGGVGASGGGLDVIEDVVRYLRTPPITLTPLLEVVPVRQEQVADPGSSPSSVGRPAGDSGELQ